MKPIFLKMTAFGPFANSQSVSFADLGKNPLFLINGPTGAGKTTLLDAMAFALYGVTTGDRTGEAMRCHHAANDIETEVIFIFALGSKHYRIERKPSQTTKAKRGDGDTMRTASANLYTVKPDDNQAPLDWETKLLSARSVNQASEQIKTLIGLDASQFRQVVVLPQGRFRDLLVASSQDREKILASLFQTQVFKDIEEAVAAKARHVQSEYHQLKQRLNQLLQEAGFATIEQLEDEISTAQAPLQQAADQLKQAKTSHDQAKTALTQGTELNKRFDSLAENQQQLEQLNAQQSAISAQQLQLKQHQQATKLQPAWQQLNAALQQLKARKNAHQNTQALQANAQQTLERARAAFEQVQENPLQIDQVKTQVTTLEKQTEQLNQLHHLKSLLTEATDLLEQLETKEQQNTKDESDLAEQITKIEVEQQRLKTNIEHHRNTEALEHKLTQQIALAEKCVQLNKKISTSRDELTQLEKPVSTAKEQLEQATTTFKRMQLQWHSEQAHALALQLEPGKPCMVCGSTDHPNPAYAGADQALITRDQLDTAEHSVQQRQLTLQTAEQDYAAAQQRLAHTEAQLAELVEALKAELTANQAASQEQSPAKLPLTEQQKYLQQQLEDIQALAEQQQRERQHFSKLEGDIAELKKAQLKLSEQVQQNRQRVQEKQTEMARIHGQIESLDPEQTLAQLSVQSLQTDLTQLRTKRDQLQTNFQQAESKLRQSEQQLAIAASNHEAAHRELANSQQNHSTAEQAWQTALDDSPWEREEDFLSALLTNEVANQLEHTIATYQNKRIETESRLKQDQAAVGTQMRPDLVALETAKNEQAQAEQLCQQTYDKLTEALFLLQHTQKSYRKQETTARGLVDEYKVIGELADTLTGDNEARISLQRFVLAVLLDDVLHEASLRLEQMTHHRFTLVRGQTAGDRRKHAGLDLMINDSYTGQTREVNTLSGGESFMAALALALGLSDVVQSYAGGIRIETLFIDEGFGSLDSEALDLAIDVLANLRASGRTIGIISHVGELKQRIHKRIDVVREADGSYLKMY